MSILIYLTPECEEDIRSHGITKDVGQFVEKLNITQSYGSSFDRFPPPYLKKRFKKQQRLIVAEKSVGNNVILCFLRILVRGGKDYLDFIAAPKEYGDKIFQPLVRQQHFDEWLQMQTKQEAPIGKPPLSQQESTFLWGLNGGEELFSDSYFIFESFDWITAISTKEISNRLVLIPDKIAAFIDSSNEDLEVSIDNYVLLGKKYPDHKICFLQSICKPEEKELISGKYTFGSTCNDPDDLVNLVIRSSGRSYPSLLLADTDVWISIEENKDYNLALSPEESELLKSAIYASDEVSGFPLFINGRAGSGKSTILQYIYSDYLRFYINNEFNEFAAPLFLTYSGSLVEKCRKIVAGLLLLNYKSVTSNRKVSADILNKSVLEFLPFMLDKVPEKDKGLFELNKFIDYARFKKLWNEHFFNDPKAKKNYSVELSWHIIRSYIKGLSVDGFLEQEEYLELPRNERNVTSETFDLVYEKVWNSWYRDLTVGSDEISEYWDSQDLVRYLLDNDLIDPKAPAVFCDEAQDFTRIELELLLRLCLFSERNIDSNNMRKVPFAFAGDPFQTLNPTGFRWEAIKSNYIEKFVHSLAPELKFGNLELNYRELNFNYRSSPNIVKLCNTIQLLRVYLFDYASVKPQLSWQIEDSSPIPVYFDKSGPGIRDFIKENLNVCIIIPCSEGEEKEFVSKDDFLSQIIPIDETDVPQNVFSPMRAKGLEFPRVILYGFGEYMPADFNVNQLRNLGDQIDKDKVISLEYFINQLYVSASRAQKRLFVIDSAEGLNKLWNFCINSTLQDELLSQVSRLLNWENEVGFLVKGSKNSWSEDKEDPEKRAQEYESEGVSKRDPYILKQAHLVYKQIGNELKSKECKALAYRIEEQYKKSGDLYYEIRFFEDALKCWWEGQLFNKVAEFANNVDGHNLENRIEVRISDFIVKPGGWAKLLPLLRIILEQSVQQEFLKKIKPHKEIWRGAVNQLLSSNKANSIQDTFKDWDQVLSVIEPLKPVFDISDEIIGDIAFWANIYDLAVAYYECAGSTRSSNYTKSKKIVLYSLYMKDQNIADKDERKLLIEYLLEKSEFAGVARLYYLHNEIVALGHLLPKALAGKTADIEVVIDYYIRALTGSGDWKLIVDLLEGKSREDKSVSIALANYTDALLRAAVYEMAVSPSLSNADNKVKEVVSDFLKEKFIQLPVYTWKSLFTPELIGSSLERAGRDIDCLKFYEKIYNGKTFVAEVRKRAEIRWAVVKERQALREEKGGIVEQSLKHRAEARAMEVKLGIRISGEPEFPVVSGYSSVIPSNFKETLSSVNVITTSPTTLSGDKYEFSVSDMKVSVNKLGLRINIEDTLTSRNVSIYLDKKDCKSFDYKVSDHSEGYFIEDIMLRITFHDHQVELDFDAVPIKHIIKF